MSERHDNDTTMQSERINHQNPDPLQHLTQSIPHTHPYTNIISPAQYNMSTPQHMPHSMLLSHIASPSIPHDSSTQLPVQAFDLNHQSISHLSPQQQHRIQQLNESIKSNQSYQQYIQTIFDKVTHELNKLHENRRIIQIICNKQMNQYSIAQQYKTRELIYSAPYFIDNNGSTPQTNIEALRKNKYLTKPRQTEHNEWTMEEQLQLKAGVLSQCKQSIIHNQQQQIRQKLQTQSNNSTINESQLQHELYEFESRIKFMSDDELLLHSNDVDWNVVSERYIDTHTPHECKIQWLFNDDPRINKSDWTEHESNELVRLVDQHEQHDWIGIAKQLNTNRTPMQCLQYYQRNAHPIISTNKWSSADERQLIDLVSEYGDDDWLCIAQHMCGRSAIQVHKRWKRSVNPAVRNGKWSRIEDMRMRLAIKAYGESSISWIAIQYHIPGRTDIKTRERWINVLRPDIINRKWNKQDDEKLLSLVQQHGTNSWDYITAQFHNRTNDRVFTRWCMIADKDIVKQHIHHCQQNGIKVPTAVKRGPYKKRIKSEKPNDLSHSDNPHITHSNNDTTDVRSSDIKKQRQNRKDKKAKSISKRQQKLLVDDEHKSLDDGIPALPPLPIYNESNSSFPTFGLINQSNNNNNTPQPSLFYSLHPPTQQSITHSINQQQNTQPTIISPTIAPLASVLSPTIVPTQPTTKTSKTKRQTKKKSKIVDE